MTSKQKTPPRKQGRFAFEAFGTAKLQSFLRKPKNFLLDPRNAAAAIEKLLGAARPGRVRLGVDIEVELVAFLAPGGTGLVLGAVSHHDSNGMIIRVNLGFHGRSY